jgi:hypothetical protein
VTGEHLGALAWAEADDCDAFVAAFDQLAAILVS